MIVGDDRGGLDGCLDDVSSVILLLRGSEDGSKAREVHDYIEDTRANATKHYDPWQHQTLITDDGDVTDGEKTEWFAGANDCYAVVRNKTPISPKVVVWRGPISDLLFPQSDPDYVKIRRAFLRP